MDNKSLHKARLESLNRTLENLLSLDDDALKKVLEHINKIIKKEGPK